MKRLLLLITILTLLSSAAPGEELAVDLRFQPSPTGRTIPSLTPATGMLRPIRIYPFVDKRSSGDTFLGELVIKGQQQKIQAKTTVAVFTTDAFRTLFGDWGGKVSLEAPLSLKGEITHFTLEESEGYQARVGFHFFLLDNSGKVLWDGHCAGLVKGTGKTLAPENYSGLFSDVLRETYAQLLGDEKLIGVWSGNISTTFILTDGTSPESLTAKK